MNMSKRSAQFFTTPNGEEMVMLPRADYDRLIGKKSHAGMSEDEIDRRAAQQVLDRIEAGEEQTYPAELVDRVISGEHPVKVYRNWKKLSQRELAEKARIDPVYLSQIETGRRRGGTDARRALAMALEVDEDLLDPRYPLAYLRLARDLSIEGLAKLAGISKYRIKALEQHLTKPQPGELQRLGKVFGVDLDIETGPLSEGLTGLAAHPVTRIVVKASGEPTRPYAVARASGMAGLAEKSGRKLRRK
jgi:transcriptional regulator with XRE-family HTH domain